ncbi:hypothetical protein GGQ74_000481 [Desulfobaculum xiamenense]|uniref:Uncharacterized protein n=1 Tax=Desulfobaculum xiamenense TaxID=995050 RepID=A0A846QF05_9BACT|nr:hypothetical protein [Desulfobaculum xiamenense]NJB66841.1 hypothetical protein [Desulfobaculum xiamenense]
MNPKLFEFSLVNAKPSDWDDFEKLSSSFLVDEFGSLRTMAAPSGDGGRDSELFCVISKPVVAAQYSVAKGWNTKINQTIQRLEEGIDSVRILIYMTSQVIGANGDLLKSETLDKGISLDIRDRNWFIERLNTSNTRESAAEAFIDTVGRPILAGEGLIENNPSQLSSSEAKTALLFLNLQLYDDINQKSLTKSSFEAIVRSVLRRTNSENRMSRAQIYDAVSGVLPKTTRPEIERFTDKALRQLTKDKIRHWVKKDEFCLSHEEYSRTLTGLAEIQLTEGKIDEFIGHLLSGDDLGIAFGEEEISVLIVMARRILECFLMRLGEDFASSVAQSRVNRIETTMLSDIIINDINGHRHKNQDANVEHYPNVITFIIKEILNSGTHEIKQYLRTLSDSYTLFSFMKETPDIKRVTQRIFSHGTIWLDTTVLLPYIAETLLDDTNKGNITKLLKTAHDAGIKFMVTTGVLEEIDSHMNRSTLCASYNHMEWVGNIPFLYYRYTCSGRTPSDFAGWISGFKGKERPLDDLLEYLHEELSVERCDLANKLEEIDKDLRFATSRLWEEKHKARRARAGHEVDEAVTQQLINHDIENYLGVIALRKNEKVSEFGYKHWLLTFDSNAWQIRDALCKEFKQTPPSPLMSLDFLSRNLSIGPSREMLSKEGHNNVHLVYSFEMDGVESRHDIVGMANKVREENKDLPDRVLKRKVRDACDSERRRRSCSVPEAKHVEMAKDEL